MREYLRWVGEQLYLFVFWPSRFAKLAEEQLGGDDWFSAKAARLRYLLKLLPAMVLLQVVGRILLATSLDAMGVAVDWARVWTELPLGVAFGVALGVAGGVAFGVAVGVAGGVAGGVAFGVAGGVAVGVAGGVAGGVAFGVAVGVAFGVSFWLGYFRLPWLVVDEGLARLAGWRLAWGQSARALWHWHPLRWNEVIRVPLAGAGAFLAALVQENRDYGLDQIRFVASHRRLQPRAVREAFLEVAKADLRCATVADLAGIPKRLAWFEAADAAAVVEVEFSPDGVLLLQPLKSLLPAFERVAQRVAQAGLVASAFRQRETLNEALAELEQLQLRLALLPDFLGEGQRPAHVRWLADFFAEARDHRKDFLQRAEEWLVLLRAERDRAAARIQNAPLPNPFVLGTPVKETEGNLFTGRRDLLPELENALLSAATAPTLLLLGARRMGKSSLLNQLPRLLGPDCAPASLDMQGAYANSLPALAHAIAREVSEALLRRRVEAPAVDRDAFERDPLRALDDWVRAVETRLPGKLRVLLCLDEYERLEKAVLDGWGGQFLDQMRHILQHHPRFGLMFTGAKPLRALGPAWTDRFISVRPLRVGFLRAEDMRLLLTKPIPEFDLDYRPGALERLMDLTRGQPFLTQCVACELVDRLNAANRKYADPADVDAAAAKALETGDAYFANLWSDAGPDGQAALRATLATGNPPASGPVRTLLRELEILTDEGEFAVPLVRRWMEAEIAEGN